MMRASLLAVFCMGLAVASWRAAAQTPLEVIHVRGGVYMIVGPGGNTTVQIGAEGVLLVDPQPAAVSEAISAEIGRLSGKPVRYILNTSADADHTGGNALASSGKLLAGGNTRPATVYSSGGAAIWAHENVLTRLTEEGRPAATWPTDTYFVDQKDLFVNGEPVQLLHTPSAHTDGDSLVMFRRSDVVSAGDTFTPDRYPVIDLARGGSINGLIDALNHLLRLTVPEFNQQGGTMVIPGHGRLSDEADVAEYRDMATFVRDRIADMVKKGMTLDQVKAARPTLDYDGLYGVDKGAHFIEQIYGSLAK